jgi:hypothetical protein
MTDHTQLGKMTATDTHGVFGDNFWPELQQRIARAARTTPVEASRMMRQFLSDSHDCWPQIRADIETNANLRALRERAFENTRRADSRGNGAMEAAQQQRA